MPKYAHLELNRDIKAPSGYYSLEKEVRLEYGGREVLYIISRAVVDASCCGLANYSYSLVPGYVVRWQAEKNREGISLTEVEPVRDARAREAIRKIIRETESVPQTEFW